LEQTLLIIVLAPLVASIIAGFFGRQIGRAATHSITIAGVAIACALSVQVLLGLLCETHEVQQRRVKIR